MLETTFKVKTSACKHNKLVSIARLILFKLHRKHTEKQQKML